MEVRQIMQPMPGLDAWLTFKNKTTAKSEYAYYLSLCKPNLTAEQEQYLFTRLRFLNKIRKSARATNHSRLDNWIKQTKNTIALSHLRLLLYFTKRQTNWDFDDCFSESMLIMAKCINLFQPNRQASFRTYLFAALKKMCSRHYQRQRPLFQPRPTRQSDAPEIVNELLHRLHIKYGDRAVDIIRQHLGLDGCPENFNIIASRLGISKQRASYLYNRSILYMREIANATS